jgi:FMN reductase
VISVRNGELVSFIVTLCVLCNTSPRKAAMTSVLIISGSPSSTSRTERLAASIAERIAARDVQASLLDVRDLPAEDLLHARFDAPQIVAALARVATADGIVVATPIYKAAYSGLLKTFLDVLPQFALRGKVVLPLATGGTVAHVLAIDYALRPVLSSLDPLHVVNGLFVLDKQITVLDKGQIELDAAVNTRLEEVLEQFVHGLRRVASAGI